VELPIAFWFLRNFQREITNVVEVGEVTPFYRGAAHAVADPAAEKPRTQKCDAADLDYRDKQLLSISTIEHIGTSDYGQTPDPDRLPAVLEKMLSSRTYLITFALGFNPQLEALIKGEHYLVLERTAQTRWRQTKNRDLTRFRYQSPWYAGNGLCVLTNLRDIQFSFSRRSVFQILLRCRAPNWSWKEFVRGVRSEIRDARLERANRNRS
jgi:hypothetical protein